MEQQQQHRGVAARSTRRAATFSPLLASSDDDDDQDQDQDQEGPEERSFEAAKEEALRGVRAALQAARREKELQKEKRRRRQEFFQEQKKRKLLSAAVLEEIDSAPPKKQKQTEVDAAEEEDDDEEEEEKSGKPKQSRKLKGNYTVRTTKERAAEATSRQRAAEDFLQSRMYGPGSCRTTSNAMLSLQNKTGTTKSAAVQFVKKDWAHQEKAKAEKLKKRWIHKQQLPSC